MVSTIETTYESTLVDHVIEKLKTQERITHLKLAFKEWDPWWLNTIRTFTYLESLDLYHEKNVYAHYSICDLYDLQKLFELSFCNFGYKIMFGNCEA